MPEPPFSDADVVDAFPEFVVDVPALGAGSFKVAYKAQKAEDSTTVVLKVLNEPMLEDIESVESDDLPDRFGRELQGMAVVDSPYVVGLLEPPAVRRIATRAHLWYLEPYYSGGTLQERLQFGPRPRRDYSSF